MTPHPAPTDQLHRPDEPVVVKCSTSADLLRLAPQLAQGDLRDSMVLVLFRGKRTHGAMRVDLPHGAAGKALGAWANRLLGTACRVEGVDGVVPIAYTDDTFAPSGRLPQAVPLRALNRAAERMGLEVRDLLCVAADGYGSLFDPALPRGGRPLDDLAPQEGDPSPVRPRRTMPAPEPASEAAQRAFTTALTRWWTHPEGPGGVLHGVDLRRPGSAFGPAAWQEPAMQRYRFGQDQADVVELVERMLDPHDDDPDAPCPCRALLYAIGSRQGLENLVLVQFGWGRETAARLWAAVHEGADSPVLDQLPEAIGGGRMPRPDVDRIEAGIAALTEVAALAPQGARAPVDGMLAWLHWSLGAGSIAGALAERALAADPDRDVPRIVLARTAAGALPEWAFREDPTAPDPLALPV